jgi:hypothetical protein
MIEMTESNKTTPTFVDEFTNKMVAFLNGDKALAKINTAMAIADEEQALGQISRLFNDMVDFDPAMLAAEFSEIERLGVNEVIPHGQKIMQAVALKLFDYKDETCQGLNAAFAFDKQEALSGLCQRAGTTIEDLLIKAIAALYPQCIANELAKLPAVTSYVGTDEDKNKMDRLTQKIASLQTIQEHITQANLFTKPEIDVQIDQTTLVKSLTKQVDLVSDSLVSIEKYAEKEFKMNQQNLESKEYCKNYLSQKVEPDKTALELLFSTYRELGTLNSEINTTIEKVNGSDGENSALQKASQELSRFQVAYIGVVNNIIKNKESAFLLGEIQLELSIKNLENLVVKSGNEMPFNIRMYIQQIKQEILKDNGLSIQQKCDLFNSVTDSIGDPSRLELIVKTGSEMLSAKKNEKLGRQLIAFAAVVTIAACVSLAILSFGAFTPFAIAGIAAAVSAVLLSSGTGVKGYGLTQKSSKISSETYAAIKARLPQKEEDKRVEDANTETLVISSNNNFK